MAQATFLPTESLSLPPITFKGNPVVTTEMLAQAYGCEPKHIRQNFANNSDRFLEGKHFYTLVNEELKEFRLCVENFDSQIISSKTRNLTLWLERGAARHAKMLNTEKAWDVFELLEETFFRVVHPEPNAPAQPDRLSRRTDPERKELTAMISAWVGCAPVHYAGARSIVNAHFGVKSVDELTVEQVKQAIQFVQGKIAEAQRVQSAPALPEKTQRTPDDVVDDMQRLCSKLLSLHMELYDIIRPCRPAINWNLYYLRPNLPSHSFASAMQNSMTGSLDAMRTCVESLRHQAKAVVLAGKL